MLLADRLTRKQVRAESLGLAASLAGRPKETRLFKSIRSRTPRCHRRIWMCFLRRFGDTFASAGGGLRLQCGVLAALPETEFRC